MPLIYHHSTALQQTLRPLYSEQRIALVPTMGNLHDGHLELVKLARQHADIVVVSIFVNPTQFGVGEDFDSYPRTLDDDVAKLATVGADYVFAPSIEEMYPVLPPATSISAGSITNQLCGQSRPTHFDGVGIVVSKLFNIIQPDVAIFGQKDYQQLTIIKQLVRDLSYSIDIIAAPIVRADDGLALSSRNQYLSPAERELAPILHQVLEGLAQQLTTSHYDNPRQLMTRLDELVAQARTRLVKAGFVVDYLEVKTAQLESLTENLELLTENKAPNNDPQKLIILAAAWLGRARLLDNQLLSISYAQSQ